MANNQPFLSLASSNMKTTQTNYNYLLTTMLIILTLFIVACQSATVESEEEVVSPVPITELTPDQIIKIGDVSNDPAGKIAEYQPFVDYLAAQLSDYGIQAGEVVIASDLPEMGNLLASGEVDLYFDSPYPALTVYEEVNAQPILRRWKGGYEEYNTLVVTAQDSGITDLNGLLGQIVAFDDARSTSGYLLPKSFLVNNGFSVNEKATTTASVDGEEIGYTFAEGDENVVAWTLSGRTAGGVISSRDMDDLEEDVQAQFVTLASTPYVPRHIVVARPDLDEALINAITTILLEMDQSAEGQAILELFEETRRFDEFPDGAEETMQALQTLFAPVRE